MKKVVFTVLMVVCAVVLALDGRSWLLWQQGEDGLWRSSSGVDYYSSILALRLLSSRTERRAALAVERGRSGLLSNEGDALVSVLCRGYARGTADELTSYYDIGFTEEPGSFPDLLSTLWVCILFYEYELFSGECREEVSSYIERSLEESWCYGVEEGEHLRLLLFSTLALLRLADDTSYMENLAGSVADIAADDNVELALLIQVLCGCGEWKSAFTLRERLLQLQNSDGSWSEYAGGDGDVLSTCLALEALDCFSVETGTLHPDLDLPADGIREENGILECLIFNNGNASALPFTVEFTFLDGDGEVLKSETLSTEGVVCGASIKVKCQEKISSAAEMAIIKADSEYVTGDINRENNIAFWHIGDEEQLYLGATPLLAAGELLGEPLFLGVGSGVNLSSTAYCQGISADGLVWSVLDNGEVVCTISGCSSLDFDWFPDAGKHHLELQVENGTLRVEHEADVEVIYEAALLRSYSIAMLPPVSCSQFSSRQYVEFEALASWSESQIEISILNEAGEVVGEAVRSLDRDRRWQWHTGSSAPGNYKAKALFRQKTNGFILGEAECSFSIEATCHIDALAITEPVVSQPIYAGQQTFFPLSFSWNCNSNMEETALLKWYLLDEEQNLLAGTSGGAEVPVERGHLQQQYSSADGMLCNFAEAGDYLLRCILSCKGEECQAEMPISVLKMPSLRLTSRVTPDVIDKGSNLMKTTLMLTSDTDGASGVVSTFVVESEPVEVVDAASEAVHIKVRNISDGNGRELSRAEFYCSVMYGHLGGGEGLSASGRQEGDYMKFQVVDGASEIAYYPSGKSGIGSDGAGIIPIYLYADDTSSSIGVIHILLKGK